MRENFVCAVAALLLPLVVAAGFSIDRSAMSDAYWNVVDDCNAPGEPSISGLFTRDMRPNTAYFAMNDLDHCWSLA